MLQMSLGEFLLSLTQTGEVTGQNETTSAHFGGKFAFIQTELWSSKDFFFLQTIFLHNKHCKQKIILEKYKTHVVTWKLTRQL